MSSIYNKESAVISIDKFFEAISDKPEQYDINELVTIVESIIPVHSTLEISDFGEVDTLLAIYPYLFQKLVKMHAYFAHKVRIYVQKKKSQEANLMRAHRDSFEQLMRAVKLQYESLSRRITLMTERRI